MEVIIMKTFSHILKVFAVIAAIVGIVYVAAVYGERIVAWARRTLNKMRGKSYFCYDADFSEGDVQAADADFAG